jgi:hypothetical protein
LEGFQAIGGDRAGEPGVQDKPGGLVVDYIGIAVELKNALRLFAVFTLDGAKVPTTRG